MAQHLGDGILAYFGYPTAHEDDDARAVRASLVMLSAIPQLPPPPGRKPLQIRIGIHTGLVVVGEIGGGEKREMLALGETPNLAARLQSIAAPNTVVLSAATQRLVAGLFDCQELEPQALKGIPTPMTLYRDVGESTAQHRMDMIHPTGLTPLVGREEELSLLHRRWQQTLDREGQVVLLSGEPGIGKSRLMRELRQRVEQDHALRIEFRCSPYFQNSALQPVIDHLQRLLQWQKDDTSQTKLDKLQTTLTHYHFPQADTLALFAALLSLPSPSDTPPLNMTWVKCPGQRCAPRVLSFLAVSGDYQLDVAVAIRDRCERFQRHVEPFLGNDPAQAQEHHGIPGQRARLQRRLFHAVVDDGGPLAQRWFKVACLVENGGGHGMHPVGPSQELTEQGATVLFLRCGQFLVQAHEKARAPGMRDPVTDQGTRTNSIEMDDVGRQLREQFANLVLEPDERGDIPLLEQERGAPRLVW